MTLEPAGRGTPGDCSGVQAGCYGSARMPNTAADSLPQRLAAVREQLELLTGYL